MPAIPEVVAQRRSYATSGSRGIVRRTGGPLMMPWGAIGRIVVAIGSAVIPALMTAWAEEQARRQGERQTYAQATNQPMSVPEALMVLRLEHPSPQSCPAPLTDPAMKEAARANFEKYMAKAQGPGDARSDYLAGKFSAAYRLLVDPEWDRDAKARVEQIDAATNSRQQEQQQQPPPPPPPPSG